MSNKKALPDQFAEFSEARRNGFLRVKELKDEGHLVAGIFCTFTPLEILDAAKFTSVSLCGMSNETIPVAEADLPKNLCPLIKSSYGYALSNKCPYTYFADLIVGETTCDGKKKMYELLGNIKKTYVLHLPQGQTGNELEQWTGELRRFINYLEDNFNLEITDEALRIAAIEENKLRQSRLKLMELQKSDPPPIRGYQLYQTMDGAGFLFDPQERRQSLDGLRKDVQQAFARGERPVSPSASRILITGCPIGGVLDKTVKSIEENNAVVVAFENCSGIKAAYQMVDVEAEDIVGAIAARYLDIGCSVLSPNKRRIDHLHELIDEFKVDGVVEIVLQACTPYAVESHIVRQEMRSLGVPYMAVETDYSEGDAGQLRTRLEAFIEQIEMGKL